MKPLITCIRCRYRWHPNCHIPKIPEFYLQNDKDWRCGRCLKKLEKLTEKDRSPPSASPVITTTSTNTVRQRCEICDKDLVFSPFITNGKVLCKACEVTNRHNNAKAMPAIANKAVSAPRKEISKKKLYTFIPNDDLSKAEMKELKRKRQIQKPSIGITSDFVIPNPPVPNQPIRKASQSSIRSQDNQENGSSPVGNVKMRAASNGRVLSIGPRNEPALTISAEILSKHSSKGLSSASLGPPRKPITPSILGNLQFSDHLASLRRCAADDRWQQLNCLANLDTLIQKQYARTIFELGEDTVWKACAESAAKLFRNVFDIAVGFQTQSSHLLADLGPEAILDDQCLQTLQEWSNDNTSKENWHIAFPLIVRAANSRRSGSRGIEGVSDPANGGIIGNDISYAWKLSAKREAKRSNATVPPPPSNPTNRSPLESRTEYNNVDFQAAKKPGLTVSSKPAAQNHDPETNTAQEAGLPLSTQNSVHSSAEKPAKSYSTPSNLISNHPKCPVCQNGNQGCRGGYPCERCLQYGRTTKEKCLDPNYKRRISHKRRSRSNDPEDEEMYDFASPAHAPISSSIPPRDQNLSFDESLRPFTINAQSKIQLPKPLKPHIPNQPKPTFTNTESTSFLSEPLNLPPPDHPQPTARYKIPTSLSFKRPNPIIEPLKTPASVPPISPIKSASHLVKEVEEAIPISAEPLTQPLERTTVLLRAEPNSHPTGQQREPFDSSVLDDFLGRQYREPTLDELSRQHWGHIDPRTVWSKPHSEKWLAEKCKEIKERGGRKANIRRLLTTQVRKERLEKGWNLHQNRKADDDPDGARVLEELFGIRGIDNFVPGVGENGELVMKESSSVDDNDGKKKRKASLKSYPVR
jgi:hypothetical protein